MLLPLVLVTAVLKGRHAVVDVPELFCGQVEAPHGWETLRRMELLANAGVAVLSTVFAVVFEALGRWVHRSAAVWRQPEIDFLERMFVGLAHLNPLSL
jgi:hypothetical protein